MKPTYTFKFIFCCRFLKLRIMGRKSITYGKSKYKYVIKMMKNYKTGWAITYPGYARKWYDTEREAAIAVDKIYIAEGREPVNILVRK